MIGSKLAGRYELLRELGRGGMGVVYLAYDPMLEREVAIKVVTPASLTPESRERFRREAKVIARMDHPAIVVVYDTGSHEEHLFFVMPFVNGKNLRALMQERPMQLGEVLDVGIQVAEALEYSHTRGIIHRDIKPENIMVTVEGDEGIRARVTDFGLAMNTTESRITRSGSVVGTIAYLSPELLSGKDVDGRSDIYSIATVLYECFAGETPFSGEIHAVLYRIAHEKVPPLQTRGIRIDEELEALILQCLEKDPDKRPQRARDLSEALYAYRSRLQQGDSMRIITRSGEAIDFLRPAAVPLVDREKEFTELQQRLNDALAGECQFVLIAGEAGIGKSRLLDEIENLARARKIRVLHGRFVEHDRSFPYQGFCEIIQEYFRAKTSGSSSAPADFADLAADLTILFPVLSEISEMKNISSSGTADRRGARLEDRTAIFELLARALIRIGGNQPLVVLLEDLHGADVSIDALQYIIRRLGPSPTLVIGTYRTEEIDKRHPLSRMINSFQGDRRYAHMELEPFTLAEHQSFLEALTGKVRISDSFVRQLYDATEGNPYFTKELVRSLLDSEGIIRTESGSLVLSSDIRLTSETLPATIQQTVEKRIERLPEGLRELVSVASVLGKTFEYRDLEMLCDSREGLEEQIEFLIQDGFIEEERESRGDRLRFTSGVVCEVLYNALSRRRRKSLHKKYAEHLEKRHTGRAERVYPQLVHHYLYADVPPKVVEYGIKLAVKSLSAFSAEEALRAARTVLEFVEDEEVEDRSLEGEARSLIAGAQRMMGNFDSALKELGAAIRVFEHEQKRERQLECMVQAAECAWEGRRVEDTRHWINAGLDLGRVLNHKFLLSRLLSLGTTVANLRGEYDRARSYLEEADSLQPAFEPEETVTPGGKIVVALPPAVQASHPALIRLDEEGEVLANVFETLLTTDARGNLVPLLCERWEVLEQGKSFLFTLRPNLRLHDGRILTSRDIKSSFESGILLNRDLARSIPAYTNIVGVQEFLNGSVDHVTGILAFRENKLGIQLTEALPLYPALLTDVRTGIALPAQGSEPEIPALAGTGPFRLASFSQGSVRLERNSDYWRPGHPVLDTIEVRSGLTASAIASGFRSGEFDLAGGLLPGDLEEIVRTPGFRGRLVEAPRKNVYFMLFNTLSSAGADPQIRMALTGIIRTQDLVWRTQGRFAHPAEGLLPPGILGHDAGRRRHPIPHEHAIKFLESASLPLPLKLRAAIHPIILERFNSLTTALFSAWSELGIEVSILHAPDMNHYLDTIEHNEGIDFVIGRYVADYDDPDNFTFGLFHSKNGNFRRYYSSPLLDQMIEDARSEMKPELRERMYRRIENHLMESGILLPLFHDVDYRLVSPGIKRLALRSTLPYVNYAEAGRSSAAPEVITKKIGGGVLRVPISIPIDQLDPALTFHSLQSEVIFNVFDTLMRQAEGARTVPWIASDCRAEDNGKRFRFRLREHVRFHDGRRLTARDVRYSFERMLQKKESQSRYWYLSPIRGAREMLNNETERLEGFKILSSSEFAIELKQPISFFPALLVSSTVAIVPEGLEDFTGSWRQGCVGTGPFRVTHFEPGERLELEPNPFYWRHGYPKSDGLIFELDVPRTEIVEGFRSRRFSIVWDLPPGDVEFLRHNPQFASGYRETPSLSTYYIVLNVHEGPLADEQLRHRLIQALDVEDLVKRKVGRLAVTAHGLIPPGLLGYEPVRRTTSQPSRSGQSGDEIQLSGMVHSIYDGPYSDLAREIFGILRAKGFKVDIQETRADIPNALQNAKTDLILSRWIGDYPDADTFAHGLLHSQKGQMGPFSGTPELDWLIEKGRTETDPKIRHSIYREVEEMIRRHALLLPIFHEQAYRFARPEVQEFDLTFSRPNISYEKLWLAR